MVSVSVFLCFSLCVWITLTCFIIHQQHPFGAKISSNICPWTSEKIMSADKYPSIFSRQVEAVVYLSPLPSFRKISFCTPTEHSMDHWHRGADICSTNCSSCTFKQTGDLVTHLDKLLKFYSQDESHMY